MFTFIANLLSLGGKLPAMIAIIRAIADIVGSTQVQAILQSIRDILNNETENLPEPPTTEAARIRLMDRVRQKWALRQLGMTQEQYVAFCDVRGVSGPISDEATV